MTEAEWLSCLDPGRMLWYLGRRLSERKQRLFAVACCRRIWHLFSREESRQAVEAAERFAEGAARHKELAAAYHAASFVDEEHDTGYRASAAQAAANAAEQLLQWGGCTRFDPAVTAAIAVGLHARQLRRKPEEGLRAGAWAELKEQNAQCETLRELVGNPFRRVEIDASWLTWNDEVIVAMTQAIYDGRAFGRLPILADALEEAGCSDAAILDHCRQPGEHFLGCWVIDLLMGKT
jgi:hypothetical protein